MPNAPVSTVGMNVTAEFVPSDITVNPNNEFNGAATTTIKNNLADLLDFDKNSTTPVLSALVNTVGMDAGSAEFEQSYTDASPSNKFNGAATRTISTFGEHILVFSDDGTTPVLSEPADTEVMHFSDEFKQADTIVNLNSTSSGVATSCISMTIIVILCCILMMQ